MPDQTNNSNSLYGQLLQRASSIGADPNPYGKPASAMMPGTPGSGAMGSLLEGAETTIPRAWQSLADISHPGAGEMMNKMYQEANPIFQKLKDAGMFSGDRTISNLSQNVGQSGAGSLIQKLAVPSPHLPPDYHQLIDYIPLLKR